MNHRYFGRLCVVWTIIAALTASRSYAATPHDPPAFLYQFAGDGQPGALNRPLDILAMPDGNILVVDSNEGCVRVSDPEGGLIRSWLVQNELGQTPYPRSAAVTSAGEILVLCTWSPGDSATVECYSPTGGLLRRWGHKGQAANQLWDPTHLAIDTQDRVFITDLGYQGAQPRVKRFTALGDHQLTWGSLGSGGGHISQPYGICIGPEGAVYVANLTGSIQVFSPDGAFLRAIGNGPGPADDQFESPYDVAVDRDGFVLVADTGHFRVQRFDPQGRLWTVWGERGTGHGAFEDLVSCTVAPDGRVYALDFTLNCVQVFGWLPTSTHRRSWADLKLQYR